MTDLLAAAGLVLVIEGLLWAAAPRLALQLALTAAQMPEARLRTLGAAAATAGAVIVWLARGLG